MSAPGRARCRIPSPGLLVLALLILLCAPAGTAVPAARAAASTVDEVTVQITAVTPQVVRPDDELVVRARVRNDTQATLDSPRATVRINRYLRSTRSSLDQWVDQPLHGTAGTPLQSVDLPAPLPPGASADVEFRVPAPALGLSPADAAWGPRGLSVEVTDGGRREAVRRTFLLWRPTEDPVTPTLLTVLVPMTGSPVGLATAATESSREPTDAESAPTDSRTPSLSPSPSPSPVDPSGTSAAGAAPSPPATAGATGTGDGSVGASPGPGGGAGAADDVPDQPASEEGTRRADVVDPLAVLPLSSPADDALDRLADVLAATATRPGVTWALDPAVVSAARTDDDVAARRWVEALTDAAQGREVVALPTHDPDLAALAHGGGDVLAYEAYTQARATSDPVFGAAVRAGIAWPADVADVPTAALAVRSGATTIVVDEDALDPGRLTYTPTATASLATPDGAITAVIPDEGLTAQLVAPDGTTAAVAAQRVLAESAVIARERPSEQRHLLAALPRGWHPDPVVARTQLTALAEAPWLDLAPLSTLAATPEPELDRETLPRRDVAEQEIDPAQISALLAARDRLAAFARITPDPSAFLAGVDDVALVPTAVAWRAAPAQRARLVDAVVAALTAQATGVSVVPGSELNLISESGRFPLGLRNELSQPVTVQVVADPASPVLRIDAPQTVTIPAESETQVRIPFHAVGSGDVGVAVTLLSPEGVPLGAPQELTVRVRADWENVGTAVVAGLLAVAFVVGIVRTIRRGQTRTRGAGTTPVSELARLPEDQR